MAARLTAEWVDSTGGFLRTGNWSTGSGVGKILYESAITVCSNTGLSVVSQVTPDLVVSSPTPGHTWYLCQDTAQLLFDTGLGSSVRLTIPGPDLSLFKTDSLTINPSNPNVAALIAAVLGYLTDNAGNVAVAYSQGMRTSRRTEQSVGI